jgi:O-antigen/teichoic acid export membrane protein
MSEGPAMTAVDMDTKAAPASLTGRLMPGVRAMLDGGTDRARSQRDAVVAFLVRCASAGLLYLTQVALARWMGSAEYGLYVTLWTSILLTGGLAHLGLNLGIIRLIPLHREAGDTAKARGLMFGGRLFALAAGSLAAGVGLVALQVFGPGHGGPYGLAAYLALICLPVYVLTDVQDGIGRGNGWMDAALVPPYIVRPLLILIAMAGAYWLALPMVATTAMMAAIAATWLTGAVQALWLNGRISAGYGAGPRAYAPMLWLSASLPLLATSGAEILLQNTDVLVISRFMTPSDVAVYFAAGKTMSLIMFVHYAVGSAMASRFAGFQSGGDDAGLRACVRDAVNWTFWPSLAAAAAILALGEPLLSLFGPQFQAGYPVMAILVVGFLTRSAMGPAEFLLNMQGQQRWCALVMMTAAALNVVLSLLLVPLYGLTGAATATAIALMTAALLNAAVAKWKLGIDVAIWRNLHGR